MSELVPVHSSEEYRKVLAAISPKGMALPTDPDSNWQHLLKAFGAAFADHDQDLAHTVEQWFPHTTVEFVPEWEKTLGLPDECDTIEDGQTLEERQAAIIRKWQLQNAQTPAFFLKQAQEVGWPDAALIELLPPICGVAECGDEVMAPEAVYVWMIKVEAISIYPAYCGVAECGEHLTTFTFQGHLEAMNDFSIYDGDQSPRCGEAECGDELHPFFPAAPPGFNHARAGEAVAWDRLCWWGHRLLECVTLRHKPAHTHVLFSYAEVH